MKKIFLIGAISLSFLLFSCVKDEVYKSAPVIKRLTISPQSPVQGQSVLVSATIFDADGQVSAIVFYKVNDGAFTSITLSAINDTLYNGSIPGQSDGATVTYYLKAQGKSGKKAYAPSGAPGTMAAYTIGAPLILMNEIYSRGTTTDPDWIELHNASDLAADISGFKIYDSGGQTGAKPKKTIPTGTIIPPKGFYVIPTEGAGDASDFGLSSTGETVWLENTKGNLIDQVAFPAMDLSQSYGRMPDGSNNWQLLNNITKGTSNGSGAPVPQFVINEIFSAGTPENPDWIEIYNKSSFEGSLRNWAIYDNGGQSGSKPKLKFPDQAVIPAKGYYVIVVDNGTAAGFGLSSTGETVWLEKPDGSQADQINFPSLTAEQSYGRFPDGSENLITMATITRGAANSNANPQPIVLLINEIYSRGTVTDPDWIEIYNPGNSALSLTGFKIYDNGGQSGTRPKKVFPAGASIPANGFYVINTEGTGDPSDFGLSSTGEKVWLEKPDGAVADSITFPALTDTQSFGRYPDGGPNWSILPSPTKGTPNANPNPVVLRVVMNEIYSRGTSTEPDWIELYNDSNQAVDLSGWKIYDIGGQGGTRPKKAFPSGATIAARGFYVINTEGSGDPSDFGLSSAGETVWFEKPDGTLADQVAFPAMEVTQSYGRKPDGSANWQLLNTITKGTSNNNAK